MVRINHKKKSKGLRFVKKYVWSGKAMVTIRMVESKNKS
jgi:hypothetical protein